MTLMVERVEEADRGRADAQVAGDRVDVSGVVAQLEAGLDRVAALDVASLPGDEVAGLLADLERVGRRVASAQAAVLDAVDRRGLYRADGHASAKAMVRHVGRLSPGAAAGRDKVMRALRALPGVAEAFAAGEVGVDQVAVLGRVHANPRVSDAMAGRQQRFLALARRPYRVFELEVRSWERLVDHDGTCPANERGHEGRDAKLIQDHFELTWHLTARYGAAQGAAMREILDHYIDAELAADWADARARHGEQAVASDLARTDAQRRADALWQLFQDAAAAHAGAVPPGFVHNIVWDHATYEELLARLDGAQPAPLDPDTYRCETLDGVPLDPTEAAAGSLLAAFRRVVVDAAGVVIDLGRARRFTGGARTATLLQATHCIWPGCSTPASRCETDHLSPHTTGGHTNPANGAPLCGRHNRWKQRGFTITRDPTGHYHTHRPDHTQLE